MRPIHKSRYFRVLKAGLINWLFVSIGRSQSSSVVRVILVAMFVTFATPLLAGEDCAPLSQSLIAWWRGDNDATDAVGGRDGTLMNGASFAPGMVNQAFSLDGTDDYVQVSNADGVFDFGAEVSFSWSAWFRSSGSANPQTVLSKEDGNRPTFNSNLVSDGTITCALQPNQGGTYSISSVGSYDDGAFHLITCSADAQSNVLSLYVDGSTEAIQLPFPDGSSFVELDTDFLIGARIPAAPDRFFNGEIDEVLIFNGALSQEDAEAIHSAGSLGLCRSFFGDGFEAL